MVHIEDEDIYLDQFKQLLQLEDYFKNGNDPCLPQISIGPAFSDIALFSNTNASSCAKHGNDYTVRYTVGNQGLEYTNKPMFKYEKEERVLKRQELLHDPAFDSNIQNIYDQNIDQLIDLEESFVM